MMPAMILTCVAIVAVLLYFVLAPELDAAEPEEEIDGSASIQDAVDRQMQPLWPSVSGTFFDSSATLDAKQKRINELSEWAASTADSKVRKAQQYWISVAQYTIDHEREDRAKKATADKIIPSLPPLPQRR